MFLSVARRANGGSGRSAESVIPGVIRQDLKHLAHTSIFRTNTILLGTAFAVLAYLYWYRRRMAPGRSAGTDTDPKEKSVKVFASPQSESYGLSCRAPGS